MTFISQEDINRLAIGKIIWLATVNSKNVSHLTPIWYTYHSEEIYICTSESSQNFPNIKTNTIVSFALEDGINPLCGIGKAMTLFVSEHPNLDVIEEFKKSYDWDITTDKECTVLINIELKKLLMRLKLKA